MMCGSVARSWSLDSCSQSSSACRWAWPWAGIDAWGFALDPFVTFFNAIPRVSLTPLLIIWFGIGINSKLAVVFLGAVFSILVSSAVGVKNLDPSSDSALRMP